MKDSQRLWLREIIEQAKKSSHIFPEMAGCEAALESGYGSSALARADNNLFGMKQHAHPVHGTVYLPTKEYLDGEWEVVSAAWVVYDNLAECFDDRMDTLKRLARFYPHYLAALAAADPLTYVNEVSKSWSSDPGRAAKVRAIFDVLNTAPLPHSGINLNIAD